MVTLPIKEHRYINYFSVRLNITHLWPIHKQPWPVSERCKNHGLTAKQTIILDWSSLSGGSQNKPQSNIKSPCFPTKKLFPQGITWFWWRSASNKPDKRCAASASNEHVALQKIKSLRCKVHLQRLSGWYLLIWWRFNMVSGSASTIQHIANIVSAKHDYHLYTKMGWISKSRC